MPPPQPAVTPLRATAMTNEWKVLEGGTSRKSTWMLVDDTGDEQPALVSKTVQAIVVPGEAASKTICRVVCPAVMTPPERVQVHVAPGWLTTLAEAPEAPTGTDSGAEMTGAPGTALTVTVTLAVLVEGQPLAAMTVRA